MKIFFRGDASRLIGIITTTGGAALDEVRKKDEILYKFDNKTSVFTEKKQQTEFSGACRRISCNNT